VVNAQADSPITLSKIEQNGDVVELSLSSDKNFIIGANRYVLHIGGTHFKYSKHPKGDVKTITFLIPIDQFEILEDGKPMVLVYGLYHSNTKQDGEGSQQNGFEGPNWSAGNLNKSLLKN
jgi:hypothetical protein